MGKGKRPASSYTPQADKRATNKVVPETRRQPKGQARPEEPRGKLLWSFHLFDPCGIWTDGADQDRAFHDIASSLRDLQQLDWSGLMQDHRRCHDIPMDHMVPEAWNRLVERRLDQFEKLMRFRCTGANRIYGIRTNDVFNIIWWDPDHRVCPSEND